MLSFLFRGLTGERLRGQLLFDWVTRIAREPHWYLKGELPDTVDGRFAVLATVTALVLVRLEREDDAGDLVSVALTERFIEVMESEHRELGLGDPTLGKTVRRLVGMLATRTDLWREAEAGDRPWVEAARESLYKKGVDPDALRHSAAALSAFRSALDEAPLKAIEQGRLG